MLAAVRYALAPACIGVAVLLHVSPAGPYLHPTGLLLLGVVCAAWFGGLGPALLAALLATLALPRLAPVGYPLLADLLDLPHFVIFGLTGAALGWGGARRRLAERRRAEEAARESEKCYERVMLAADAGLWDWDVAKDEFHASPRLLELCGLPPGTVFSGREDFARRNSIHPEDKDRYEAAVKRLFAGSDSRLSTEVRVIIHGETQWRHIAGICFRDEQGRVVRWTGSTTDITARKRAEEARRLSVKRYALAMEAAADGHMDWDLVTGEHYLSPRMLRMVGHPTDATFADRPDWVRRFPFHPDDRKRWEADIAAHFAGREAKFRENYRIVVNGETRWLAFNFIATRDASGKPVRWTGSIADINDAKLAEEALRASEERYERVMLASDAGFWEWDVAKDEFYASPRLVEMSGLAPGTTFAGREDFMRRVPFHPEDRDRWQQAVKELFASGGSRVAMEVRYFRNGEAAWVRLDGMCFRDAAGRVLRWTGSSTEITERKRAEEELRHETERLQLGQAAAHMIVMDWNIQEDSITWSDSPEWLRGPQPASGRYALFTDQVHPEDRAQFLATRKQAFETLQGHTHEFRFVRTDGKVIWVLSRQRVFADAEGKPARMLAALFDITDRKRAEEALRASEKRYSLALEAAEEGHFDISLETDEIFTSERFNEIHGFAPGTRFGNRSAFLKQVRFCENDGDTFHAAARAILAKDAPDLYQFEYRILWPSEEVRWVRMRGKVTRDAEGRAIRRTGVVADITEAKLAAEARRQSEERYALAMEASEEGHWDYNITTGALFISDRLNEIYGFPPGERFHRRSEFISRVPFHPEDAGKYHDTVRIAEAKGGPERYEFEFRILRPSGEVGWLKTHAKVIRDAEGRAIRRSGVIVDITPSKLAADELRKSEERFSLAVEGSNEGIFDWDLASDRVYVSYRAQELFGLPRGELWRPRRDWRHILAFHPEDAPRLHDSIKAHIEGGSPTYDVEFRIIQPGGAIRWFRQRGIALRDEAGKAYRVVGSIGDVTERHVAEEELGRLERQLRMAQRLEAMGTLAGGIAHDFNNILGVIVGYGEMALRAAKNGTRLRRDLDAIMSAGERGRALVDRILAFSRSGVGERVPVHVEEVVREALDQLAAKVPGNVTIAPRLRGGRAAMLGDSTQVHQVVMNLANNAAQAMPHGGVVRVTLEAVRLEAARSAMVGTLAQGDYLVLQVSDAGTGIAPEVLEHMFDPFFTTKEIGVGSGLGLSLVHGIVTNVGGAIDVTTELGKGSTFTVYLPRSGEAPAKVVPDKRPLPRGQGQRVLVVDDEEPLVRVATETLERLGYAPVPFTSSTAALAAFRADPGRFDAVLTDERMPGLSGTALIREVRGIREAIPVVLMSGYLGMEAPAASLVVRKPLSAAELAASLARALHP